MANGFNISLAHNGEELSRWTTFREYTTLEEVKRHVPIQYEPGTYKMKLGEKD